MQQLEAIEELAGATKRVISAWQGFALEGVSKRQAEHPAHARQGIRKAELARRLGWHVPQVDRLFDLRHASKLDQIEAAALSLGRTVEVRVT